MSPIKVSLGTTAEEGSCNGCGARPVAVFVIGLKNSSFRVCGECRRQLVEALVTAGK